MVLMERIVRPHLPVDSGPSKTAAKCRQPEENKVAKFDAPPNAASPSSSPQTPKKPTEPGKPTEKTRNSSWSYSYKRYMTKKEKEQDKCKDEDDRIVGGASATDKPPAQTPGA